MKIILLIAGIIIGIAVGLGIAALIMQKGMRW